ncbi:hypothetical protein [Streptomyces sp. DH8]|uniref:hypothetical protein n=1 Tax=Streptomyces sp. DH8 TaxID=2857008 RepID=UPI001E4B94ED|nr:hypothetical protein [Streptomyces sp. DH8]
MTTPKPHESVQGAAAFALGGFLADTDARRAAIEVRTFATSEDANQAIDQGDLPNGSVFVVDSERIVGFVVIICPAALTEEHGPFPHLPGSGRDYMNGDYVDSVVVAEREARARGFLLRDEDAQDRIRSMRRLRNESSARIGTRLDAARIVRAHEVQEGDLVLADYPETEAGASREADFFDTAYTARPGAPCGECRECHTDQFSIADVPDGQVRYVVLDFDPIDGCDIWFRNAPVLIVPAADVTGPGNADWTTALSRLMVAVAYLNEHAPPTAEEQAAAALRIRTDLRRIDQQYGTARP